jgi:hypothetical protein
MIINSLKINSYLLRFFGGTKIGLVFNPITGIPVFIN